MVPSSLRDPIAAVMLAATATLAFFVGRYSSGDKITARRSLNVQNLPQYTLPALQRDVSPSDQVAVATDPGHQINDVGCCGEEAAFKFLPSACDSGMGRGVFDKVYEEGRWGAAINPVEAFYSNAAWPPKQVKSSSGAGSQLGKATETSLAILRDVINTHDVQSMLDVPCGDVLWIFDSYETDSIPLYLGLDVAGPVIDVNTKRFAHHSNKHFAYWDAAQCTFPRFSRNCGPLQPFDLVHSRDVIQHMPLNDGLRFLCHVMQSGAKIFVTTTYGIFGRNIDIKEGQWYRNKLDAPPFDLPRRSGNCTRTHTTIEPDETCIYDLRENWVEAWTKAKC